MSTETIILAFTMNSVVRVLFVAVLLISAALACSDNLNCVAKGGFVSH